MSSEVMASRRSLDLSGSSLCKVRSDEHAALVHQIVEAKVEDAEPQGCMVGVPCRQSA